MSCRGINAKTVARVSGSVGKLPRHHDHLQIQHKVVRSLTEILNQRSSYGKAARTRPGFAPDRTEMLGFYDDAYDTRVLWERDIF